MATKELLRVRYKYIKTGFMHSLTDMGIVFLLIRIKLMVPFAYRLEKPSMNKSANWMETRDWIFIWYVATMKALMLKNLIRERRRSGKDAFVSIYERKSFRRFRRSHGTTPIFVSTLQFSCWIILNENFIVQTT